MTPLAGIDEFHPDLPLVHKMSFGKDSYATLEALLEAGIRPSKVVYNDTGWEALEHYDYMEAQKERLLRVHGIDVVTVSAHVDITPEIKAMALDVERAAGLPPSPFVRYTLKYKLFPRPVFRKWCTKDLKILPTLRWLKAKGYTGFVATTGVRRDESRARANHPIWEQAGAPAYQIEWRPIALWTASDVGTFLASRGVPVHPLYDRGCSRVGCWPCIHAGKADIERIGWDKRRVEALRLLESFVKGMHPESEEPPAGFFLAKGKDADGRYMPLPIDDAIAWSRTSTGGKKYLLFPRPQQDACERWGWCEV